VPVVRLLVIAAAAWLIVQQSIDPTFENLITLFGAVGLALGFAFKDYTSSLIAGIVTLYEMPYRLGDWISVEGAYGEVKAIGMRAVEIVTADDTVVVIPHLKLWDKLIFNANDNSRNLQCTADFYLHPRHDAALVRRTLHDVGLTSPYLQVQNQKPVAVVVQEKPWGTHYRLKAYPVDPRDQFRFITDLTVRGKAALLELGLEFAVAPAAVAA
jgi:small-conductance mechanosensitive channel